ncbi:unnamed protein product, partial [Mesorhabditis spiculigera]
MPGSWKYSTELIFELGMCPAPNNYSLPNDVKCTVPAFETEPTIAPIKPADTGVKWLYLCLIIVVLVISALAVFCTIRRLFYKERPIFGCFGGGNSKKASIYQGSIYYGKKVSSEQRGGVKEVDEWEVERWALKIGEEKLGSGAYAVVYQGKIHGPPPAVAATNSASLLKQYAQEWNPVAVKMPPLQANFEERQEFLREIAFMKKLGFHPHLLTLLGCSTDPSFPLIIMELCDHGDLLAELRRLKNSEAELLELGDLPHMAWQISDALVYLSSLKLIHRDIAARNVLLTGNKFAKLGDFGLCRLSNDQFYLARGGRLPVKWTAPEALERNEFSVHSDVWSFGVLLFEIYSLGQQPYATIQPDQVLKFLRDGRRLERPELVGDKIWKLMCNCWELDPTKRPTPQQLHRTLYREIERSIDSYGYLDFGHNYHTLEEINKGL